jgi:hypothetical protein
MRTNKFINHLCIILLISFLSGCTRYPAYEITESPFVNKTSLEMYIGDQMQVTASPVNANFKWTSKNEAVATVNQTGLVKAVGEGLTTILVESDNEQIRIDVIVKIFIPLIDITLPIQSVVVAVGEKLQVFAYPVPDDATESISWSSANTNIVTVDESGFITAVTLGKTTVTASSGDIAKNVDVNVAELYKCDKIGWTVEAVSDESTDGGGKDKIIDGSTSGFWHSQYNPDAPFPHWAIIDMKTSIEVAKIATLRRSDYADTKTLQYFIGNDPDPNANTWKKIAEGAYASPSANHTLTLNVAVPVDGKYLKLVLPDSFRETYTAICEIDVWALKYDK